jgi:beta-lactamase regulating signal transducer with metallopeptidase domain
MNPWMQTVGWTLVHFLWQGMAIAVLTASSLRLRRFSAPTVQYVVACAGLALMLAAPVVTALVIASQLPPAVTQADPSSGAAATWESATLTATADDFVRPIEPAVHVDAVLPLVVWTWVAGVLCLVCRLSGGCWRVYRLRSTALRAPASGWQSAADRVAAQLALAVRVRVRDSVVVDTPMVIGWVRPVIVLPVAALANLSPLQVEAVLAHELAHIRRHDFAVNVAQTIAETLLFYHPAVWWLSARIRATREHCCDDVAVEVCRERGVYAEALAELELARGRSALALAATDGSLLHRVRRVLGLPSEEEPRSVTGLISIGLALSLVAAVIALVPSSPVRAGDRPQRETVAPNGQAVEQGAGSPTTAPELPPGDWRVYATDHFDVYYPSGLDLHATRLGDDAERAYQYMSADLKHDLAFRIPILLFPTAADLSGSGGQLHVGPPAEPSRQRIVFAADRRPDEWYGLIAHEVAHVFGYDIIPGSDTPQWLTEGLAEYQRNLWDPNDLVALREVVRAGQARDIAALTNGSIAANPRLVYSLGHAAFEFVEWRWGKDGVRRFLFALRQAAITGSDPYAAALQMTRVQFEEAFGQYLEARFAL